MDSTLIKNPLPIGQIFGVTVYCWQWIEPSEQLPIGVIAQEVQKTFPEAVEETESGFLEVDYQSLLDQASRAYFADAENHMKDKIRQMEQQKKLIEELQALEAAGGE
ncbi:MAG: tail fiber domain-containing protein [Alphaproteobacteria bacterium]